MTKAVMEALEKVRSLNRKDKLAFVKKLLAEDALHEDVKDSLAVAARRGEPREDYTKVAQKLKAQGRIK